MAYNTATLIDSVIEQSKDSSFSRSLVLEYIQRTQDEVLGRHRFKFNEGVEEVGLSDGTDSFEYECDHQEVIQLIVADESNTIPTIYQPKYLTSDEFFDLFPTPSENNEVAPSYYTDYNGNIQFNAPFDKSYIVKMRYVASPKTLQDTTSSKPQIPIEFKNILIRGGLAGVEQYRENYDIAALHERKIEDLADDLIGRYGPRKMGPGKARTRGRVIGENYYTGVLGINRGTF